MPHTLPMRDAPAASPRALRAHERRLLERLLSLNSNYFEQLPDLDACRVREMDRFGGLLFEGQQADTGPLHKLPLEMVAIDADGGAIHALLLLKGRALAELQFYKTDGSPIRRSVDELQWTLD